MTIKASFSNDQKLVQAVKDKTIWFYQQVSHTTQLQGFWAYMTVNLSDKKGDNVFSRELNLPNINCELIMIVSYFAMLLQNTFGDSNKCTRDVGFVW